MKLNHEQLLQKILDAPVGKVEKTIRELLNCDVSFNIVEQNKDLDSKFVRKITITANDFPVIIATVNFDYDVIPTNIIDDLLRKKEGVGTILSKNNIKAERKIISLDFQNDKKIALRKYQIIIENRIWFEITEEIRLDSIITSKNS